MELFSGNCVWRPVVILGPNHSPGIDDKIMRLIYILGIIILLGFYRWIRKQEDQ